MLVLAGFTVFQLEVGIGFWIILIVVLAIVWFLLDRFKKKR